MKYINITAFVLTGICFAGFVLTLSLSFAAGVILFAAFGISGCLKRRHPEYVSDTKKNIQRLAAMLLAGAFFFQFPPLFIESSFLWQYPFQKMYTGLYRNVKEPDFFFDFRNDVQGDYCFEYLAAFMQGSGSYSVRFKTTPEIAAAYSGKFSPVSEYIIPLDKFNGLSDYTVTAADGSEGTISVTIDEDFFGNSDSENTFVFILETNLNWNHPHTSAVIVDKTNGLIQLSRLG